MAEFEQIESWAEGCLRKLGPAGRRRLTLQIARDERLKNIRRMRSQRGPDGEKWEGRKRQRKAAPIIRYVYRKKDGSVRELEMSSYRRSGGKIIGYDKEAGGVRTMIGDRVIGKVKPRHSAGSIRARAKKAQSMMQGLASARHLRARATPSSAVVEFSNRAARIAAVHHWGQRDKVSLGGPDYDYPARPLLGISKSDAELIRETILEHIAS
ncbi:phage virion morphogenesis protein [Comamonas sp. SY3]|uniref:phage virion morphogenesis protein n=1 Tax=Comamonas sp. SY3 TaxID=3243601 RepID=UPI00359342E7